MSAPPIPTGPATATTGDARAARTDSAFPRLDADDLKALECLAVCEERADGEIVFRAGQPDVDLFVRSDPAQLSHLADLVDRGELRVDVQRRVPLAELPALHAEAAAGGLSGKTVVVVDPN